MLENRYYSNESRTLCRHSCSNHLAVAIRLFTYHYFLALVCSIVRFYSVKRKINTQDVQTNLVSVIAVIFGRDFVFLFCCRSLFRIGILLLPLFMSDVQFEASSICFVLWQLWLAVEQFTVFTSHTLDPIKSIQIVFIHAPIRWSFRSNSILNCMPDFRCNWFSR